MKQLSIFLTSFALALAAQVAHASSLYLADDVCTNSNCSSQSSSYGVPTPGPNNLSGQFDWDGVIDKGTNPYETFGGMGYLCALSDSDGNVCEVSNPGDFHTYTSGNQGSITGTVQTEELGGYYGIYDTFTAGGSGFTGNVVMFGDLEWPQEGGAIAGSNCNTGTPTAELIVECDDTSDASPSRPAVAIVSGNNSWASSNITYYLDGWSPAYIMNLNLAPGASESIGYFVVLDGIGTGPYTPDASQAIADGEALLNSGDFSWANGQPVNFGAAPEPGTMGLAGFFLCAGAIVLRRRKT